MREPWRIVGQVVTAWARTSNARAVDLARAAAVECSRRAVERAEVTAHLLLVADQPSYAAGE